jgi:hypothetical protein
LHVRFAGDAHNLTHDIDGPLRRIDPELGIDLCHGVLALEREFASEPDREVIATEAERTASLMEAAGAALGILE